MKIDNQKGLTNLPMAITKVTTAGSITEAVSMSHTAKDTGLRKLNADEYLNTITGEVKQYQHTENRSQNINAIKRTMRTIRLLVNANVLLTENILWVTYTYAENMTDASRVYKDFQVFWLRFQRWLKKQGYDIPEYIQVVEPQGRGAWHMHVFYIWEHKAPFIPNNEVMEKLWGHGFTKTKALNNVDNIGAYFSAYLADIPVEEALLLPEEEYSQMSKNEVLLKSFEDESGNTKEKKFIKGGRLYLYPTGMKIIRHSRGIKYPETKLMLHDEWQVTKAKRKSLLGVQTFSSSSLLYDDDGNLLNAINREYYNTKRQAPSKRIDENEVNEDES